MKYTQIQRNNTKDIITIGDYISETQPITCIKIEALRITLILKEPILIFGNRLKDVTQQVLTADDVSGKDRQYAGLMQERPRGGRGGLLAGEGEDALEL